MDQGKFRKKVFMELLTHPWTLLPAVSGLSLLVVGWSVGKLAGLMGVAGVFGLLAGAGALATRWIFKSGEVARKAFEAIAEEEREEQSERLDDLYRRLKRDRDPRTGQSLRRLRQLHQTFREGEWSESLESPTAHEISNMVEKLFRGCIMSLEHSLELWSKARRMKTKDGRRLVMERREDSIEEVARSIEHMAKTIDGVLTMSVRESPADGLARIRRELDESLEVARRVEERMRAMDAELAAGSRAAALEE